jgi:hypothetical protein
LGDDFNPIHGQTGKLGEWIIVGFTTSLLGAKHGKKHLSSAQRHSKAQALNLQESLARVGAGTCLYLGKGLAACTKMQWINVVDTYGNYGEE